MDEAPLAAVKRSTYPHKIRLIGKPEERRSELAEADRTPQ
jgi:hypothetical protein